MMPKSRKLTEIPAKLSIPKNGHSSPRSPSSSPSTNVTSPVTPKTPADEGIDFFQSAVKQGESPIDVYELRLDPDGGPNRERSVSRYRPFLVFPAHI